MEYMRLSNYTHTIFLFSLKYFQDCIRKRLSKTNKWSNEKIKKIEKETVVAERLKDRFAMMGFIALVGAYLTTGQIIPGFV